MRITDIIWPHIWSKFELTRAIEAIWLRARRYLITGSTYHNILQESTCESDMCFLLQYFKMQTLWSRHDFLSSRRKHSGLALANWRHLNMVAKLNLNSPRSIFPRIKVHFPHIQISPVHCLQCKRQLWAKLDGGENERFFGGWEWTEGLGKS